MFQSKDCQCGENAFINSTTEIYLPGYFSEESKIYLPLSSSAIVFVLHYCCTTKFKLVFTNCESFDEFHVDFPASMLDDLPCLFVGTSEVPHLLQNCRLPVVHDKRGNLIRSGLCSVVRHIVKTSNDEQPNIKFSDLLGFRNGSLRAPAEVSGWTKLCEVELPESLSKLLSQIEKVNKLKKNRSTLELPIDVIKLEKHFLKPPKLHNDDRHKRAIISDLQQLNMIEHNYISSETGFQAEIPCTHGVKQYLVTGSTGEKICEYGNHKSKMSAKFLKEKEGKVLDNSVNGDCVNTEDLAALIGSIALDDIHMIHLYSEGLTMTVADLILFPYIYCLLKSLSFDAQPLTNHVPRIIDWVNHMITLPRVLNAAEKCKFGNKTLVVMETRKTTEISFLLPCCIEEEDPDNMELSRTGKTKYRAIKPDVDAALAKIQAGKITPVEVAGHPRCSNMQVDWPSIPKAAQPAHDLPEKRVRRKCQQLENLVTVVQHIAKAGDVIVDFCSGGGHLGIITAFLLPDCQIYLIENKEESLMRAKDRVDKLKLKNVTLYQCNQDYFSGKFDIGMCLHACGVATDMVLQQCLQNQAAFVVCPCCYGGVRNTHLMTYPRSQLFQNSEIEYKEFQTLGHVADMTECNTSVEEQGKYCMNLVDTDRLTLAKEKGYTVTLCSLQPLSCTPKNNLLIGIPPKVT